MTLLHIVDEEVLPVGRLTLFGERGGLWSRRWTENRELVSALLHSSWSNQEAKRRKRLHKMF